MPPFFDKISSKPVHVIETDDIMGIEGSKIDVNLLISELIWEVRKDSGLTLVSTDPTKNLRTMEVAYVEGQIFHSYRP